jgi:uncharacterized protein (TIGR02466 family)
MIIHKIFPTYIGEFDLSKKIDTKLLWNELKNLNQKSHPLLTGSGTSTYYPGNESLLDLDVPLIKKLKVQIELAIDSYVREAGLISCQLSNSWLSIMNEDTTLLPHRHEASVISGAYYPYVPNNSVGLTVMNPLKPYRMCEVNERTTEYTAADGTFPVKEGLLIIFPSWLEHKSDQNESNGRAVVSFNTVNNAITTNYKNIRL